MESQLIILGPAFLIALVILAIGIRSVRQERDLIEERLGRYGQEQQSFLELRQEDEPEEKRGAMDGVRDAFDNAITQRSFGKRWRQQLARADIKLTVAEYAALHVVSMVGFFLGGYIVLFSGNLVMALLSGFVGFFAPRLYVSRATSQRLVKFERQLPDTLGLWVNALRSGFSVLQAMEAISKDAPEPTATEFRRVVQEVQLGIDMEEALEHLLVRVESEDLDLVVTAVNVQREVGGNLAEILDVISHTVRERIKLKGEIQVLTAQGRITGYVISGLPITLALFLMVINPHYMGNLFSNRMCGWPMLGIGLALIGLGTALIQKIVDIDI